MMGPLGFLHHLGDILSTPHEASLDTYVLEVVWIERQILYLNSSELRTRLRVGMNARGSSR